VEEEVIEKPDVADEVILRALEACYSIHGTAIEFVPRGLDAAAWAYRVEDGEAAYFLKVSRGVADQTGAWMPRFLAQQGMRQVIPPIPTNKGEAFATVDGLRLRLQPFIAGERAMDVGMSSGQWTEFGRFLRQLHSLRLSADISSRIRHETFAARRLPWVEATQARIATMESCDPISDELISFWRANHTRIALLLERTAELAKRARQSRHPMVLCHADVHTGNILLGEDQGMYVVDWDDAMLAPKERDLMFVLAEADAAERDSFFAGYGAIEIDALMLAYYQHDWSVEDMGAFGEETLNLDSTRAATRANSLHWFINLFAPGSSLATALANDAGISIPVITEASRGLPQ
jgi:spectinomycin phosphotransferase